MAYYPLAPKIGARYSLTGPNSVVSVFNDPLDPNYVGMLKEMSGLDSPEIREVADDLVQQDGGVHGDFWFGRRTIAMNGIIFNVTEAQRDLMMDRIQRSTMAMRGDATLSWKPPNRRENLITNPRAVNDTSGWSAATGGNGVQSGGTLSRVTGAGPPVGTTAFQLVTSGAGSNNQGAWFPISVVAGKTYAISIAGRRTAGTGSMSLDASGPLTVAAASNVTPASWTVYTVTGTASTTGTAWIRMFSGNANTLASTFQFSDVMITEGTNTAYFDGDTAGFYWQGASSASTSGDFIEMFTTVRRQQPLRFTGGWNKEYQIQLVSEYANVFSTALLSVTGTGVTAENRGSALATPTFSLTGSGTPTQVAITGVGSGTLKFTGLTLAGGETIVVDTFNHSAVFTAGARNGQSGNRYIDFTNTTLWPTFGTGNNTITLSGTGTLVTTWRDTWA